MIFEDWLFLLNTPYPEKKIRRISAWTSPENTFVHFPMRRILPIYIRHIQLDKHSEILSTDTPYPPVGYDVSNLPLRHINTWEDLVEKFVKNFYQLSDDNEEMEADESDDPNDIAKIFKIKGIKTYEGNELNNNMRGDLEEPWSNNGVPYQLYIDGFCNEGELPGMVRVRCMTYFQDHKWRNNDYNYKKDCPLKEEGKTLEKAYYTQFRAPYQPGGRQALEESLTKFMAESAKRHEENSNIIKKEKDPGSFTLPCFIHDICFDKALVDLGASVSVMPFSTYSNLGLDFVILDIPKDDDVPLILGRPFLSTAHAKIDVFKRKITLRVGEEKLVFKSIKPATSIIRRVYMVKERTDLDSKTEFVGEAINESFDPLYGNYIELNDLDMPLEPRMNQDDFEPTLDFINEPTYKSCYKMKFSCMIGYKHVNAGFLPSLSINIMTKHFSDFIIKDKCDHEGKNQAGTLTDKPIFVGNFSIISGFSITNDVDITSGVVLGMPFFKKFVSCQKTMEKFAHGDE
ncbi:hypothetical protein Tco_0180974 [Tanacetum coccineum]